MLEDGVPQQITNFARDPQPIALSLLIDSSTSMEPKLVIAQEAAIGFARRLSKKDVAQIIDFDSQTQILQTFTTDESLLERAIRRTRAGGSTSLYNALYVGLDELKRLRVATTDRRDPAPGDRPALRWRGYEQPQDIRGRARQRQTIGSDHLRDQSQGP